MSRGACGSVTVRRSDAPVRMPFGLLDFMSQTPESGNQSDMSRQQGSKIRQLIDDKAIIKGEIRVRTPKIGPKRQKRRKKAKKGEKQSKKGSCTIFVEILAQTRDRLG